jgi:hypothetical protein
MTAPYVAGSRNFFHRGGCDILIRRRGYATYRVRKEGRGSRAGKLNDMKERKKDIENAKKRRMEERRARKMNNNEIRGHW